MAKFKLDVKKIKEVLTSRYEILGLAIAGGLTVLCLIWGFSEFLGASSHDGDIQKDANRIKAARMNAPRPGKHDKDTEKKVTEWPPIDTAQMVVYPMFRPGDIGSSTRVNPPILTVDNDPKGGSFQVEYHHKGIHTYELSSAQDKLMVFKDDTNTIPVVVTAAKRLVVVTGTFPYAEQIKLYLRSLRVDREKELFDKGLAPTFEGLNVQRRKITFKGGARIEGEWEKVYDYDADKDEVKVNDRIQKVLQMALYDTSLVAAFHDVIYGASVTPLPLLTNDVGYPEIQLPEIVNRPRPVKKGPIGLGASKQPAAPQLPVGRQPYGPPRTSQIPPATDKSRSAVAEVFQDLDPLLRDQVSGVVNYFSVYGTFPEDPNAPPKDDTGAAKAPAKAPEPKLSAGPVEPIVKQNYKAPMAPPLSPKAMIRFFDADMPPGATYQYRVQVRMANPNYGQPQGVVSNTGLAKIKELVSEWVEVPQLVTVPYDETLFYFTNQDRNFVTKNAGKKAAIDTGSAGADKMVPFQILRFIDSFTTRDSSRHYIADWVVAERILVARGETIGRDCEIEMVEWNKIEAQWHVSGLPAKLDPKQYKFFSPPGTPLLASFRTEPPVVLLDFTGGKQTYKSTKAGGGSFEDECAPEVLLLNPDKTMTLRNGQDDWNDTANPAAQERRLQFEAWRDRLQKMRTPPASDRKG